MLTLYHQYYTVLSGFDCFIRLKKVFSARYAHFLNTLFTEFQQKKSNCYREKIQSATLQFFLLVYQFFLLVYHCRIAENFFCNSMIFFLQFYGLQNYRKIFFYTSVEKCMEKMGVSCKKIMSLLKLETVLATVTFCLSFQGTIQCCSGYLLVFFLLLMVPFMGVGRANPKTHSLRSLVWVCPTYPHSRNHCKQEKQ